LHRSGITPVALAQPVQISTLEKPDERDNTDLGDRVRMLWQMNLFRAMNHEELQDLASALKILRYGPGDSILHQGDEGDSMFIISKGSVRVMLQSDTGQTETLAVLGVGDFFGEMSLLTGAKRSASVFAAEEAECLRIDKSDFTRILERRSELVAEISMVLAARQASLSAVQEILTNQARIGPARLDLIGRIERFFGFTGHHS
jgi:CRP-like cAMP-binding protein